MTAERMHVDTVEAATVLGASHDPDEKLRLPDAPADLEAVIRSGGAVAWSEPLTIRTYEPDEPSRYPMFLDHRVYQGSSGKVYPLPFTESISDEATLRDWQAIHLENEYVRLVILPGARRSHPRRLRQDHGLRLLLPQQRHQAGARRPRRAVDQRRRRVQLAAAPPAGDLPARRDDHRGRRRRHPSPSGAPTTTRSPGCRRSTASGCARTARSIELVVRLHNRTERASDVPLVGERRGRGPRRLPVVLPRGRALRRRPRPARAHRVPRGGPAVLRRRLPGARARPSPDADRIDCYRNIPVPTSYMIVDSQQDFFGGYDHAAGAGFVHWAERRLSPGKKQWTWGDAPFGQAWDAQLTDDDGPYVELMAGVYTDNQPDFSWLLPGETKVFTQYWYPIPAIGVAHQATPDAAVHVDRDDGVGGDLRGDVDRSRGAARANPPRRRGAWPRSTSTSTRACPFRLEADVAIRRRRGDRGGAARPPVGSSGALEPDRRRRRRALGRRRASAARGDRIRRRALPHRTPPQPVPSSDALSAGVLERGLERDPGDVRTNLALADRDYRAGRLRHGARAGGDRADAAHPAQREPGRRRGVLPARARAAPARADRRGRAGLRQGRLGRHLGGGRGIRARAVAGATGAEPRRAARPRHPRRGRRPRRAPDRPPCDHAPPFSERTRMPRPSCGVLSRPIRSTPPSGRSRVDP